LGAKYGTPADVWSAACLVFELLTGDLLFDPRSGKEYDRDEDHLALMMELIGPISKKIATFGKHSREFFTRNGELRHIRRLKHWPIHNVLHEKYGVPENEAHACADFLQRMLHFDPDLRATATQALAHPWLDEVSPPRGVERGETEGDLESDARAARADKENEAEGAGEVDAEEGVDARDGDADEVPEAANANGDAGA